jgi:hypothetical protein
MQHEPSRAFLLPKNHASLRPRDSALRWRNKRAKSRDRGRPPVRLRANARGRYTHNRVKMTGYIPRPNVEGEEVTPLETR